MQKASTDRASAREVSVRERRDLERRDMCSNMVAVRDTRRNQEVAKAENREQIHNTVKEWRKSEHWGKSQKSQE